jgi:hypothetical protein
MCGIGGASASAQTGPGANVAFGYSFLRLLDEEGDLNMPAGWLVSVAKPVGRSTVSVVGEVAGNYKSEFGETLRLHTIQGGVRLSAPGGRPLRPFAQFTAGVMAIGCCGESEGYFTIEPGGGVDIALTRRLSLRIAGSFPTAFADGDTGNTFRFHTAVVVPLIAQ